MFLLRTWAFFSKCLLAQLYRWHDLGSVLYSEFNFLVCEVQTKVVSTLQSIVKIKCGQIFTELSSNAWLSKCYLFFFFFWDRVLFCDHAVLKLVQECAQLKLVFWEIFLSVLPSSLIDSFKLFLIWNLPPTKEILLAGWQADQTTESKHYHVSNVPVR